MHGTLKLISYVVLAMIFFTLVFDIKQASRYKETVKDALDISTKAAALQLDENPNKISNGQFEIEPAKSKEVFEKYMADNLDCSVEDVKSYILDDQAVNIDSFNNNANCKEKLASDGKRMIEYTNPANGKIVMLNHPTFVAVMKFKYRGILLKKDIVIDNLAGSRMTSRN